MDSDPNGNIATVPLMIPIDLYKNLESRIKLSNGLFKTVEDYLTFILTEVVKEEQDGRITENGFSTEEEEEIKGRLKNLGYI
jgi:hypothetical protein